MRWVLAGPPEEGIEAFYFVAESLEEMSAYLTECAAVNYRPPKTAVYVLHEVEMPKGTTCC